MSTNKLKLNPDKTEFLLIGNEWKQTKCLSMFPIELHGVKTNAAKSARNFGVIVDKNFIFCSCVSAVCSSCFYHMWDLWHIHGHLDLDSAKLLASALVSTCLHYCNSLLYDIANIDLIRLQNRLAHLVTKSPSFTRSVKPLRSLHWLPVRFRIFFKINLLTYKTLCEKQPVSLHSMLAASLPFRSLRSNNDNSPSVPSVETNTGTRAISSCAPSLWNNLKKHLKTHLFLLAFPP